MSILAWIIVGFVAGLLASIVMKTNNSQGMLMDIVFGIIGAFVGGLVMNMLGQSGVSGLNIYSIMVATLGAMITIWVSRRLMVR